MKKYRIVMFCLLFLSLFLIFNNNCIYAKTDPTLVSKLNTALKEIQGYLVKLSTPAAGIAIVTGALIRKFSFGDEEKMRIGKKIIINAIVCYGIILSLDLIIKFIETVLK